MRNGRKQTDKAWYKTDAATNNNTMYYIVDIQCDVVHPFIITASLCKQRQVRYFARQNMLQ